MLKLYGYWRSSAAYRVRIALNHKNIPYEQQSVHLVKKEQHSIAYQQINPNRLVPTLVDGDFQLNQSLAILDYLESTFPEPALLPSEPRKRAEVLALATDVACDIHPLNNLRVLQYLSEDLTVTDQQKSDWYAHWITEGFAGFEAKLQKTAGDFCFGDTVTWADLCLIPQVYNAHRFKVELEPFPTIRRIDEACNQLPAFVDALPENQEDAVQPA